MSNNNFLGAAPNLLEVKSKLIKRQRPREI